MATIKHGFRKIANDLFLSELETGSHQAEQASGGARPSVEDWGSCQTAIGA